MEPRIGLVLGAGGTSGAQRIFGALDALQTHTGFRPEHATVLVGTSIGAIKAGNVPPHRPPSPAVFERLAAAAEPPSAPSFTDRLITQVRRNAGRLLALVSRPGGPDPLTWVEGTQDNRATICSMRRWPPERRVVRLEDAESREREIAASAAIPFGAQPVLLDGAPHVDGAVWSVTNADVAPPDDLDLLIVIAPLVATDGGTPVSASARHQLAVELGPWHRAGKPVIVIAPSGDQYARRSDRAVHRADAHTVAAAIIPSR